MNTNHRQPLWMGVTIASCAMLACGATGMVLSFLFMTSSDHANVTGGGAGFIAGAIMMGAGLISLAIVSSRAQA